MKHLGQSVFKGLYGIVKQPSSSKTSTPRVGQLTPGWVVQNFGNFELRRDYYEVFQKIGGLLLGTDAILYHWAEFTARIQKDHFTQRRLRKSFKRSPRLDEEDRQSGTQKSAT